MTNVLNNHNLPGVDFLKIDTEGYDFFVLKGFPWSYHKPCVIECEFEDKKSLPLGYNMRQMADFLIDKGYQLLVSEWHPIVEYGYRHDWRCLKKYPCELEDRDSWGNLLAFAQQSDLEDITNFFGPSDFSVGK